MAKPRALLSYYFLAIFSISVTSSLRNAADEDRKVYIVYMGALPGETYSPYSHHLSMLQSVVEDSSAEESLIVSYKRSFNGFAARLTERERQKIASMKGVVSVFPSKTLQTHTTRSWDFMGFPESVTRNPTVESDTIIAIMDTGIWPESESFSDECFGPPPKKWKGVCAGGANFTCNNKIIGARFYNDKYTNITSARDDEGHGTQTASVAAGNTVKHVSFYGLAEGTARGAVPLARIAVYKVCSNGCDGYFALAAADDAIADGVDIINISFGLANPTYYLHDPIAIAAFHASKKGILTLGPAGNDGPSLLSVTNIAPWLMTVAASGTDRRIIDKVVLGNGTTMIGNSVNSYTLNGTTFPLIHGKSAVSSQCADRESSYCNLGCLETSLVEGKIVVCDEPLGSTGSYIAGAVGTVLPNPFEDNVSLIYPHAAAAINDADFKALNLYINSSDNPRATILRSEVIKLSRTDPVLASFSSRGPNIVTPDILKPDITAPGIEILAAYTLGASPSDTDDDTRRVKYSIETGTSIACSHVAGVAAYVKSFHPDWSPSAVKSSLMTTVAMVMKQKDDPYREFGYGSGQVNPVKALNPGLVYEAYEEDYVRFLCSVGCDDEDNLRRITGDNSSCPADKASPRDLNYPSMCALVSDSEAFTVRFHRRVKNVGTSNSTYKAQVFPKAVLDVQVEPAILKFESLNEVKSFDVVVKGRDLLEDSLVSTSLVWSDGTHNVRSPIVIHSTVDY